MFYFYFYFSFAAILSLVLFWDIRKTESSKWWVLFGLAAPVTVPYYIITSHPKKWIVPILIFFGVFMAVIAGETVVYKMEVERMKYIDYSSEAKQMIRLCDDLKQATINLDNGIRHLEEMSKLESRETDIAATISFIGVMRLLLLKKQEAVDKLVAFVRDYETLLAQQGLKWQFQIVTYYNNSIVTQYTTTLKDYLKVFEELLQYTFDNFKHIKSMSPKHLHNYDSYYINYRRAVDRHNRIGVKRMEFQNSLIKANPELKPFLPDLRTTEFLRFWG